MRSERRAAARTNDIGAVGLLCQQGKVGENVERRDVGGEDDDSSERQERKVSSELLQRRTSAEAHPFSPLRIDLTTSFTPRLR